MLRLKPIVSLFKAIHPAAFYYTTTEGKSFAYSSQDLNFCLGCLFSESSHLVSGYDDVFSQLIEYKPLESFGCSKLKDNKRNDHESSNDQVIYFDLIVFDVTICP